MLALLTPTFSGLLQTPLFQVQNLTLRSQQTPAAAPSGPSPTQPVLTSLALKPTPGGSQPLPTPSQGRNTAQGSPAGAKSGTTDSVTEPPKRGDSHGSVPGSLEGRAGLSRMVPAVAAHPLIAPGKGSRRKDPIPENSEGRWVGGNFHSLLFPMGKIRCQLWVSLSHSAVLRCSSAPDSLSCFLSSFKEGSHVSGNKRDLLFLFF